MLLGRAGVSAWLLPLLFRGDESRLRSDSLRRDLLVYALKLGRDRPWLGTGSGSFEFLWATTGGPVVPPRHGFAELLAENGLLVAGWLFALVLGAGLLALLPVRAGPPRSPLAAETAPRGAVATATGAVGHGPQRVEQIIAMQHLLASPLIGFVLAGFVVSAPLPWFPWWFMLSGVVTAAAWLQRERRTCRRRLPRRAAARGRDTGADEALFPTSAPPPHPHTTPNPPGQQDDSPSPEQIHTAPRPRRHASDRPTAPSLAQDRAP